MGLFDSMYIKCPKCGKEMEWQSKSGHCAMFSYNKRDVPISVAEGLDGSVLGCQFCNTNWQFKLISPRYAKFKIIKTKKKRLWWANHNPKHPDSIKKRKELAKLFGIKKEDTV